MVVALSVLHVLCVLLAVMAYDVPLRCASCVKVALDRGRLHKVADAFCATLAWLLAAHWMELAEVSGAHAMVSERRLHELKYYWGGYHGLPMFLRWLICGLAFSAAALLLLVERLCSSSSTSSSTSTSSTSSSSSTSTSSSSATTTTGIGIGNGEGEGEGEDRGGEDRGSSTRDDIARARLVPQSSRQSPFRKRRQAHHHGTSHQPLPLDDSQEVPPLESPGGGSNGDDGVTGGGQQEGDQGAAAVSAAVPNGSSPISDRSSFHDDVDRAHLTIVVLRQLLHKTLTNIGAISLLRAVETTLTPSSWLRLVSEDLVIVQEDQPQQQQQQEQEQGPTATTATETQSGNEEGGEGPRAGQLAGGSWDDDDGFEFESIGDGSGSWDGELYPEPEPEPAGPPAPGAAETFVFQWCCCVSHGKNDLIYCRQVWDENTG